MYVSFDIKTGGKYCGILQLSAEMVRVELSPVESPVNRETNERQTNGKGLPWLRQVAYIFWYGAM